MEVSHSYSSKWKSPTKTHRAEWDLNTSLDSGEIQGKHTPKLEPKSIHTKWCQNSNVSSTILCLFFSVKLCHSSMCKSFVRITHGKGWQMMFLLPLCSRPAYCFVLSIAYNVHAMFYYPTQLVCCSIRKSLQLPLSLSRQRSFSPPFFFITEIALIFL